MSLANELPELTITQPEDFHPQPNCPQCSGTGIYPEPNGEDDFDIIKCDCSK